MEERQLIYDWNSAGGSDGAFDWTRARVDLNDETLRDGLQSPSVTDPSLDVKKRLLHLMADLGIVAADIGLPGAGPRVVDQVRALAKEIRDHKLPIAPNCAARTVIADTDGTVAIAPFENPALAAGGTGDVLAGAIGSLLAQGVAPFAAARLGVYLHGVAGDSVRERFGDAGLLASDLPEGLAVARKRLATIAERKSSGKRLGFSARESVPAANPGDGTRA